jgi:hypothetical protein
VLRVAQGVSNEKKLAAAGRSVASILRQFARVNSGFMARKCIFPLTIRFMQPNSPSLIE